MNFSLYNLRSNGEENICKGTDLAAQEASWRLGIEKNMWKRWEKGRIARDGNKRAA